MVSFQYCGGLYVGSVKYVSKTKKSGKKVRARRYDMIPHGHGVFTIDGMRFEGRFRNGYEELGKLTWPDGKSYFGRFNSGYPEPKILQHYHQTEVLKDSLKHTQSELILKQAQLDDVKETLDIERETTMAVALALDRCQSKLRRVFEFASELNGVNAAELHNICFH
jgi:hypothetical protein